MSSRRAKAPFFSKPVLSDPYESDSVVSFVADKTSAVKFPTLLDKVSNGAAGLRHFGQSFGQSLVEHAMQTFVASDTEGSDQDSDDDSAARARRARKKAIGLLLQKAGTCAASLKKVAEEVDACRTECLGHLVRDDDESWASSGDERPTRRLQVSSEVTFHDGNSNEDTSIATDHSDGMSIRDWSTVGPGDSSSSSSSQSSVDLVQKARREKLRRRRQQFLRRRAMERAAGAETEDDDESSFHFGRPRIGLRNTWSVAGQPPSQELRRKDPSKRPEVVPDLVNTSNEDSLPNTTHENDASPEDDTSLPPAPAAPDPVDAANKLASSAAGSSDGPRSDPARKLDAIFASAIGSSDGSSRENSRSVVDEVPKARRDKLRWRRRQFLRRRAMERAAGATTEDIEASLFHRDRPRIGLKQTGDVAPRLPSQEMRREDPSEPTQTVPEVVPDLVNTSNEDSLLNTTYDDDASPKNASSLLPAPVVPSPVDTANNKLELNDQTRKHGLLSQSTWQSMEKATWLPPSSADCIFLEPSHLGPRVAQAPCEGMVEIVQPGDVIIRLNGIDVRSLEARTVSEMIGNMAGNAIQVTFLRKNMIL